MQIAQSTLGDKEAIHIDKCVGPKWAPGSWETWGHWVLQDRTRQTTFFKFFLLPFAGRLLGLLNTNKNPLGPGSLRDRFRKPSSRHLGLSTSQNCRKIASLPKGHV